MCHSEIGEEQEHVSRVSGGGDRFGTHTDTHALFLRVSGQGVYKLWTSIALQNGESEPTFLTAENNNHGDKFEREIERKNIVKGGCFVPQRYKKLHDEYVNINMYNMCKFRRWNFSTGAMRNEQHVVKAASLG